MEQKYLFLIPIGLGNYIMTLPAIRAFKKLNPLAKLHGLCLKKGIVALVEVDSPFHRTFCWEPDKESFFKGIQVLQKLRSEKYTGVYSLFPTGHWKYSLFLFLLGNRVHGLSYPNSPWPKRLYSHCIESRPNLHDVEQNLYLVEYKSDEMFKQESLSIQVGSSEIGLMEKYFVCHPGSSAERGMDKKRLPSEKLGNFIHQVVKRFYLKCVLIGGPEEAELRKEVAKAYPDDFIEVKTKSIPEVLELERDSLFYLGNDSGLMHMAVSQGKRCIVFFGPTSHERTGPYPLENHLILRDESLECQPCWDFNSLGINKPCQYSDYRCLHNFNEKDAFRKAEPFIQKILTPQSP